MDDHELSVLYGQPPSLSSSSSSSAQSQLLDKLNQDIKQTLSIAYRCNILLEQGKTTQLAGGATMPSSTSASSTSALSASMSSFLSCLSTLDTDARLLLQSTPPVLLPLSLYEMIDNGVNPDQILSTQLDRASNHNDAVRGKMNATAIFRDTLIAGQQLLQQQQQQQKQTETEGQTRAQMQQIKAESNESKQ